MVCRHNIHFLTIVRHGQTDAYIGKLNEGWEDCNLNYVGMKQAQAVGKALKHNKISLCL